MTRSLRPQFEDALYCITVQGNNREAIFRDHSDQSYYIDLLNRYRERFGCRLYGYILLANHLHIILETPRGNVGKFMQGIGTSYASYFNRRHKRRGTLFEGRYRSLLVPKDQLFQFTRRIQHLCRLGPIMKVRKYKQGLTVSSHYKVTSNQTQIQGMDLRRAKDIIQQVSLSMGLDGDGDMRQKRRKATARHLAMYLIRKETHLPLRSIGTLLGVKAAAVAIAVGKVEKRLNDGEFSNQMETLLKKMPPVANQ